jgi:hypothetical protein
MAVDVDRHDDSYLRRHVLPGIRRNGRIIGVAEFRGMCAEARAQGFDAFPSCDNFDERGHCRGCPIEKGEEETAEMPAREPASRDLKADATPARGPDSRDMSVGAAAPPQDSVDFEEDIPRPPPPTPDEADDAARFVVEARRRYKWTEEECDYFRGCLGITRAKATAEARRRMGES